jgi:hypothetical protein
MMFMAKAKVLWLSVMVVLSLGGVLAGSASAAIEFKWKVAGAELKTGESKEFVGSRDGVADLRGTVAGVAILMLSRKGAVATGAKIIGGVPGTGEEALELEEVTVDKPAGCDVMQSGGALGTIRTVPLKTEIVEGAVAAVGNNEVDVLITPKTDTTFATFEFVGTSCSVKGVVIPVAGSVLGLPLPQKVEVLKSAGDEEAVTKEYKNHAGEFKKTGLIFAGEPATISGLVLVSLKSDQVVGAF